MSLQAELDHEEQSLLEFPEVRPERAWSRSHIGNEALSADAGTEFVRARMPATQPQPTGKPRIVDSPDDHPDQDEGRESRHAGFLRRRPVSGSLPHASISASDCRWFFCRSSPPLTTALRPIRPTWPRP